jgi:hypothetical protein
MDVRDFSVWSREAVRRALLRRSEMYGASLLPHQKENTMRRSIDDLNIQFYELDHGEAIEKVEAMAKQRLEQMKERRRGVK